MTKRLILIMNKEVEKPINYCLIEMELSTATTTDSGSLTKETS